jgi:hypothetical protein
MSPNDPAHIPWSWARPLSVSSSSLDIPRGIAHARPLSCVPRPDPSRPSRVPHPGPRFLCTQASPLVSARSTLPITGVFAHHLRGPLPTPWSLIPLFKTTSAFGREGESRFSSRGKGHFPGVFGFDTYGFWPRRLDADFPNFAFREGRGRAQSPRCAAGGDGGGGGVIDRRYACSDGCQSEA